MVKLRKAGYCNLKLFLLFLVVYGHWIENRIDSSEVLHMQYRLIYFVHMPLFVFLSGLFIRNGEDCVRQVKRLLPLYAGVQLLAVLVSGGAVSIWTPFWHLWYLLSFCWWAMAGWLWLHFFEDKSSAIGGHLLTGGSFKDVQKRGGAKTGRIILLVGAVQFLYHAEPYDFAEQDSGMAASKKVRLEDMTEHLGELEKAGCLQERMTGIVKPEVVQRFCFILFIKYFNGAARCMVLSAVK